VQSIQNESTTSWNTLLQSFHIELSVRHLQVVGQGNKVFTVCNG